MAKDNNTTEINVERDGLVIINGARDKYNIHRNQAPKIPSDDQRPTNYQNGITPDELLSSKRPNNGSPRENIYKIIRKKQSYRE